MGFKIGGWGKNANAKSKYSKYSGENPPVHIVKNCISANNKGMKGVKLGNWMKMGKLKIFVELEKYSFSILHIDIAIN